MPGREYSFVLTVPSVANQIVEVDTGTRLFVCQCQMLPMLLNDVFFQKIFDFLKTNFMNYCNLYQQFILQNYYTPRS